jgi:hypothetical protein
MIKIEMKEKKDKIPCSVTLTEISMVSQEYVSFRVGSHDFAYEDLIQTAS